MEVLAACMPVQNLGAVLEEVRRGHWDPWDCSYKQCKQPCVCWELNFGPLEEQSMFLTIKSFFSSPLIIILCASGYIFFHKVFKTSIIPFYWLTVFVELWGFFICFECQYLDFLELQTSTTKWKESVRLEENINLGFAFLFSCGYSLENSNFHFYKIHLRTFSSINVHFF